MGKSESAEEMRARLLSQYPNLKDDLENISDLELLPLMVDIYKSTIVIKEAKLIEIENQLDEAAKALFSPALH
ncbi:hypothetical protein JC795_15705 [Pseudomonas veronii]|uniref:hypothetical protein n=1 Tax=Pseudomonas veronii TaxID=76761 RepID=UPI0018E8525B|nr:hypothetical protein [Pseudomonas veronii]MBJ2179641.1 hypothetical protein [Pseudomonas veronii]